MQLFKKYYLISYVRQYPEAQDVFGFFISNDGLKSFWRNCQPIDFRCLTILNIQKISKIMFYDLDQQIMDSYRKLNANNTQDNT